MSHFKYNVPNFTFSFLVSRPSFLVPRPSSRIRHPTSVVSRPASRGFTYIGLLVIIVVIGISLGAAGKYWQNVMLRDKEKELLFRGDQYRIAIDRYTLAIPGRRMYPHRIKDLLKDPRTITRKRHLRRKYSDPITGEDFVLIRDPATRRIIGVHSKSELEPLKKEGFPEHQKDFADKEKYSEWKFVTALKLRVRRRIPTGRRPPPRPTGGPTGTIPQ
jgi:type II secretory pathway pseudopilin PulG